MRAKNQCMPMAQIMNNPKQNVSIFAFPDTLLQQCVYVGPYLKLQGKQHQRSAIAGKCLETKMYYHGVPKFWTH